MLATLAGTATYEIEADVLTIRSGTNGLVLRGAGDSDAAAAIEGVTWTLDSIVENTASANTVTAVPALDQPATLTFDAGTVDRRHRLQHGLGRLPGRRRTRSRSVRSPSR